MNNSVCILDRPTVKIILNKELEMFTVDLLSDDGYNPEGFDEFLKYFKNTWKLVHSTKEIFKLCINLEAAKDNEIPLTAYMNLLKCIADINDILKTNCHCICIFTHDCDKWQDAYNFITKLWNPKDQRPLLFTDKDSEKTLFLQSNKLITEKY
tara:strand:- start:1730 stop:2188 length:459 start_codon:yes stop_codon:yes gene_type:complete